MIKITLQLFFITVQDNTFWFLAYNNNILHIHVKKHKGPREKNKVKKTGRKTCEQSTYMILAHRRIPASSFATVCSVGLNYVVNGYVSTYKINAYQH